MYNNNNNNNNNWGQEFHAKGSWKEIEGQIERAEVQWVWDMKCVIVPVITGATGMVTNGLKKDLEAVPGNRLTTKDRYTWNITLNTENTAVWNLKRWGLPLVQEK